MTNENDLKQLLDLLSDKLTSLPNVVGLGITSADAADPRGAPAVAVYVSKKVSRGELTPAEQVPGTVRALVDGRQVEAPTRVIEVGEIKPG
ncbi:MAG TPA: hypothetical protein VIE43_09650 [Thermoanaerobaculia bacterium]|nr:hypothetical protein [Thermoanaerobaculia bacterium]